MAARAKADARAGWAGRRMRWIIDERSSRDEGLGVTWRDWLAGLGPWGSLTESDARTCGVGLSWDSARLCPIRENLGLTCPCVDKSTCEVDSTVSCGLILSWILG